MGRDLAGSVLAEAEPAAPGRDRLPASHLRRTTASVAEVGAAGP